MFLSPQPNKATPDRDNNGHYSEPSIANQLPEPSDQQQAAPDYNQLLSQKPDVNNGRAAKRQRVKMPDSLQRWWQGRSLRTKATALALAIGTLPIVALGTTAYYFANRAVMKHIIEDQTNDATLLEDKLEIFIHNLYSNIEVTAELGTFADPKLRASTTRRQKDNELDRLVKAYGGLYDSIAVLALNGNVLAQSQGVPLPNQKNAAYFRTTLTTNRPYISEPQVSTDSRKSGVYLSAPIKDLVTGKSVAIAMIHMPTAAFGRVIDQEDGGTGEYFLINPSGKIFLAGQRELIGRTFKETFPQLHADLQSLGEDVHTAAAIGYHTEDQQKEVAAYAATEDLDEEPYNLRLGAVVSVPAEVAFGPLQRLQLILVVGTGLTAVLVGAIATYLAKRATRPLLAATGAVEKLGQGELDTRLPVAGSDELATLGSNINRMAEEIQTLLQNQAGLAERAQLIKEITLRIGQSVNLEDILNTAVQEIRQALNADRVIVYRFNKNWQGETVAESVAPDWPRALGAEIADPQFRDKYVEYYRQGQVQAIDNIYTAGLSEYHLKQLETFAVKAKLLVPILQGEQRALLGLLIAHQCDRPRAWQQGEIDLFSQLATQLGFALDRAHLLEQQKTAKEQLQKRALELLVEVDPISKGDLTTRARVTEDEIGTIADSYNATVGNLRKIVNQVQAAAGQVATTTSSNSDAVQALSANSLQQTQEILTALARIQEMADSSRTVAANAEQAEAAVQQAAQTVEAGDTAMNRTVDGILAIRETVAQTAKKVKRLGESSQKISRVINLINNFAAQTNLLALNASIEAARAGEDGRGFAVVADEVRTLARQSATATSEIEKLITAIQVETSEVVAAMEAGTEQVVVGTKLVDDTRQSLTKIAAASTQIHTLVEAIAQTAIMQSQASEAVTQTMTNVAAIADKTSTEATSVSESFQQLLAVAQELQASVSQFKVS